MNHCCFHLESLCDLEEEFTLIQWIFSLWCHQFHPCLLSKNFFYMFVGCVLLQCFIRLVWIHLFGNTAVCFLRAQPHSCMYINQECWMWAWGGCWTIRMLKGLDSHPGPRLLLFKKKIVFIYFHQPVHVPVVSQWGWRERVAPHTHRRTHIDAATSTQSPPQACGRGRRAERGGYGWGWWSEVG